MAEVIASPKTTTKSKAVANTAPPKVSVPKSEEQVNLQETGNTATSIAESTNNTAAANSESHAQKMWMPSAQVQTSQQTSQLKSASGVVQRGIESKESTQSAIDGAGALEANPTPATEKENRQSKVAAINDLTQQLTPTITPATQHTTSTNVVSHPTVTDNTTSNAKETSALQATNKPVAETEDHVKPKEATPLSQGAAVQAQGTDSKSATVPNGTVATTGTVNNGSTNRSTTASTTTGAGSSRQDAKSSGELQEEKKEEEKKPQESPIKQRAASYKDEEVKAVQALSFAGNSEQAMESFTTAGASAIAASYPALGDAVNQKLGSEKQQAAQTAPVLTAGSAGVKDPNKIPAIDPGTGKEVNLPTGVTEGNPAPPGFIPHENPGDLPTYRDNGKLDQAKPAEESGGFWSWLTDTFKNLLGGISTSDGGVSTSPGATPELNTQGDANPQRAANVSEEGKGQITQEQQATAATINNNPGQQNIQPIYFEEPKPVVLEDKSAATAATPVDPNMQAFASLPLPESVRKQADADMAASMEKSLAKPREDAAQAADKRDTDKESAIKESQAATEKLNQDAEKEQQQTVESSRQKVADEQAKGVKEAQDEMASYNKEADAEQLRTNTDVQSKITESKKEADGLMTKAEEDAEKEKQDGEKKAAAEKKAADEASKEKSWWGKFKDAVGSAVSWLTDKIGKIFDAVRSAIKFIIDKAKKLALAAIEAGRKWIVDKLDKFGTWLKEKVNKYLKNFPALAKRINAFIDTAVEGAKKVVNQIADTLKKGVEALAAALGKALDAVLNAFQTALTAAVQIAGALLTGDFAAALKIAFLAVCKVAGIDPQPILNFIEKAGETISIIFNDPVAFFKNVATGVGQGIDQFVTNIKQHLINGLITWLTGALSDIPIKLPTTWDLKGIFSLIMQILGLTYEQLRAKLVKRIGPNGEEVVSKMESAVAFIRDLIVKGPIVLWEKIQEKFEEIKEMAMEKIRTVVSLEVVKAGVKWLISLLNPASAIVRAIIMLYDFVMFIIERKDQIIAFVTSVFDTVGPLARGETKQAANSVEGAMGKSVPVILSLLASLAGIGGIGKSVQKVLETVRKPIDNIVDPVIDWLVTQGTAVYEKGKALYQSGKEKVLNTIFWWRRREKITNVSNHEHSVFFLGEGKAAEPAMQSKTQPIIEFVELYLTKLTAHPQKASYEKILNTIKGQIDIIYQNRTYTYTSTDGTTKTGVKDKVSAESEKKINSAFVIIMAQLALLPEMDSLNSNQNDVIVRPKSVIKPQTASHITTGIGPKSLSSSDGEFVDAPILSLNSGGNSGSPPSNLSVLVTYLKSSINGDGLNREADITPAHILNQNLYGKGTPENIVPLPRIYNKQMSDGPEKSLRDKVLNNNDVVSYTVKVNWPDSTKFGSRKGFSKEDDMIPEKVSWTITTLQFDQDRYDKQLPPVNQTKDTTKVAKEDPGFWVPSKNNKPESDFFEPKPITSSPNSKAITYDTLRERYENLITSWQKKNKYIDWSTVSMSFHLQDELKTLTIPASKEKEKEMVEALKSFFAASGVPSLSPDLRGKLIALYDKYGQKEIGTTELLSELGKNWNTALGKIPGFYESLADDKYKLTDFGKGEIEYIKSAGASK